MSASDAPGETRGDAAAPELSSTAPLTLPDFHRYEDYGELTFVGPVRE
jgi:hypothetical protein